MLRILAMHLLASLKIIQIKVAQQVHNKLRFGRILNNKWLHRRHVMWYKHQPCFFKKNQVTKAEYHIEFLFRIN